MSSPLAKMPLLTHNGKKLTPQENNFIISFLASGSLSQAVKDAGYRSKAPSAYGRTLLEREAIREELEFRMKEKEDAKIASATEVLQFYTSVMRGEILDQFGIEASLDTRIKAANELAKHQIEIPLKLEQRNTQNNIGSITINFVSRNEENEEIIEENEENP